MSHFSLSFSSSWLATPSEPNTDHPNARDASKPSSKTFGPTNILMLQGYSSLYALPSQSTSSSSSARSSPAFSEDSSSEDESAPESETTAQRAPQAPPPTPAHASFPRASRIRCPTSTLPPRPMPSPRRKTGLALNTASTSAATATRALPKTATRLAVPLPFSDTLITNRVEFTHVIVGRRGVCLAEWARLAEKRRTHLALARGRRQGDAEVVEDMFAGEERVVFQSYWPGYNPHTRVLDMPAAVAGGARALTHADLLDMVCGTVLDWMVTISNSRHIACCQPGWAVGLDRITFKDVHVVGMVEVEGYVRKWVPLLEVEMRAADV